MRCSGGARCRGVPRSSDWYGAGSGEGAAASSRRPERGAGGGPYRWRLGLIVVRRPTNRLAKRSRFLRVQDVLTVKERPNASAPELGGGSDGALHLGGEEPE